MLNSGQKRVNRPSANHQSIESPNKQTDDGPIPGHQSMELPTNQSHEEVLVESEIVNGLTFSGSAHSSEGQRM